MSELTPRMRYIIGEVLDMVDVDTLNDNLALDTAPDTSREELNAIQSVVLELPEIADLIKIWRDEDSHIRQLRFTVRRAWPRLADALDALS